MIYETYPPVQELRPFIKCYWTLEEKLEAVPHRQTIVPDGCMEMIFHYGDLYKQCLDDGTVIIQPRSFIVGQLTKPLVIEPTGHTGIFSVRFQHDGFLPFVDINVKTMVNTVISLNEIFGEDGTGLAHMIMEAGIITDRIFIIENFLKERLIDSNAVNLVAKSTVDVLLAANGYQKVSDYSNNLGVNRRQLERQFAKVIGLSPKQFGRIIRLQTALKMLLDGRQTSLTALAYENGYYDQAHFIKDFKEFTGLSPKNFYGEHVEFSSLFYGTD